jgi:hypothetical protein
MKNRVGRVQRQVRRALVAAGGRPVLTLDLLRAAFPDVDHYEVRHYQSVWRAAPRWASKRRCGKGNAWTANDALARLIAGDG